MLQYRQREPRLSIGDDVRCETKRQEQTQRAQKYGMCVDPSIRMRHMYEHIIFL
jgi:hypothetical protein